jgi:hypothetical protein
MNIMIINGLNLSPVTSGFQIKVTSSELGLKKIQMSLFNRVNGAQHIPVHRLGTGGGSHRSLVDPSSLRVHHVHELTVADQRDIRVSFQVPLHLVKELVDHLNLLGSYTLVVVINIKDDAPGGKTKSIGSGLGGMHSVHFKVVTSAVNGMLTSGVEMELHTSITIISSEN